MAQYSNQVSYIEKNEVDVTIGDHKVLDDVKIDGVKIPKEVCIGVCMSWLWDEKWTWKHPNTFLS